MNWKLRALTIWVLAVPAFTGVPLSTISGSLVPGVTVAWFVYGALVYGAIGVLLGKRLFRVALMIACAITAPLVVLGGIVSCISLLITGWRAAAFSDIIFHYTGLAARMLVVIPLALSMVAVLPFHRLESRILQSEDGVTLGRKIVLMFLRVFSHIIYFVIPTILEVVREEGTFPGRRGRRGRSRQGRLGLGRRFGNLTRVLVTIAVEAICSAIRFIPLWAEEISMLPNKRKFNTIDTEQKSIQDPEE